MSDEKKNGEGSSGEEKATPRQVAEKGGKARAEKLSPERRSEIAREAATSRWERDPNQAGTLPRATHEDVLRIGDVAIPCAVLKDGRRVLLYSGIQSALGRTGNAKTPGVSYDLERFFTASNLKPFAEQLLSGSTSSAIQFRQKNGMGLAWGYPATILPDICSVFIDAKDAGKLNAKQESAYQSAKVLQRAFAKVGIIALVDEATGYQAERDRDELQRILAIYISPELMTWTDKFPPTFFKELFRIYGWEYRSDMRSPRYAGKLINKYVYERLPPGVLAELRAKTPRGADGRLKNKLYNWLSAHTGDKHLDAHLIQLMAVMRAAESKAQFERMVERSFPMPGDQVPLIPHPDPELGNGED